MQHKVFQHAPQSILSAPPFGHHDPHKHSLSVAEASRQKLKRTRKPARRTLDSAAPPLFASESSFDVADGTERGLNTLDDQSEDEEVTSEAHTPTSPREAKRRKRHLDNGDVGRFATLTIDQHDKGSKEPPPQPIPNRMFPAVPTEAMTATSVEEPEDEDDIDMRSRRGATTHQIDSNRFYVTSLSDESEDEDAREEQKRNDQIDAAIASSPNRAPQDSTFVVNGELINRLQVLESHRRHALARDRAFQKSYEHDRSNHQSGCTTPIGSKTQQGALILWKSPKELSKEIKMHADSPVISVEDNSPPVVIEDGNYACVRRSTSPFVFQKTTSSGPLARSADEMEID